MLLVNMRKARVGNGKAGKDFALVAPGAAGDFDAENPTVALLVKCGDLVPEGAVLASKAVSLAEAPSMAELVRLRSDLAQRDAALADRDRQALAHAEERKRIEDKLSELVAEREGLKAKVAALESDLAFATAPPAAAPAPAPEAAPAPAPAEAPTRATRKG